MMRFAQFDCPFWAHTKKKNSWKLILHEYTTATCFFACKGHAIFFASTLRMRWKLHMYQVLHTPYFVARTRWISRDLSWDSCAIFRLLRGLCEGGYTSQKKMTSSVRNQKYIARGVDFAISRQSTGLSSRLHKSGYTRDFSPRACNANFSKISRPLCKEKYNSSSRSFNVVLSQFWQFLQQRAQMINSIYEWYIACLKPATACTQVFSKV